MTDLTHTDEAGRANMVDVGAKDTTRRQAVARGFVHMSQATLQAIADDQIEKGEALSVARLAGIMGAKRTSELIPLCHQVPLDTVEVRFMLRPDLSAVAVEAVARCSAKTGVEMEALAAVTVAALTIYDMCKAIDKAMHIGEVHLAHKSGGRSGDFDHPSPPGPAARWDDAQDDDEQGWE